MSRPRTQYGVSLPSSTHSSAYTRTSPVTNTNVSSLAKSIRSGGMNISPGNISRPRPPSRFSQASSPERPIRTTLTNVPRARLPSQDRSVCFS